MNNNLPSTPADVLEIPAWLRFTMNTVCKSAEVFKFWDYPYKKAATSFEEMTLLDKLYWVYKCNNPVTLVEREEEISNLLKIDKSVVKIPEGFKKESSITLGAAGDLIQAEGLDHSKDVLFENIADLLFDQTVSYANLESPLTEQELKKEVISDKESPIECCSKEQFDILKGYKDKRFTVMHTAGNHMFDMGVEGVQTTLKAFSVEGILDVGTNKAPEDFGKGKIITKGGIKIGFVSATYGLNGHDMPSGEDYRINVAKMLSKHVAPELDILKKQINHCKSEECDFIIASLHWGYEFEFFPRKRQVDIAHTLVEWGADAIIAHHPHVIQPVEYYPTQRDPNRVAIIAYSLGSLTWAFSAPYLVLSAILNLTITKGAFQGKNLTYIEKAKVTPVFCNRSTDEGVPVTRIEKLADHLDRYQGVRQQRYLAEINRYADLVLGH